VARGPALDRIDLKILATLQDRGRVTNAALAEAVGLSASPCLQRVKRLEAGGYIRGYGALVDLSGLGETITVFTEVTLASHTRSAFLRFEAGIAHHPELRECHLVSGGYDYLLKFLTRSVSHYQAVIEAILDADLGVQTYFSTIVIRSPLRRFGLPIESLTAGGQD